MCEREEIRKRLRRGVCTLLVLQVLEHRVGERSYISGIFFLGVSFRDRDVYKNIVVSLAREDAQGEVRISERV